MNPSMLRPSKDWMNIKVDKETANFLLKFFVAEELAEAVADKYSSVSS